MKRPLHETPSFDEAAMAAASALHIKLRDQAAKRNAKLGTARGTYYREGLVAGHAKGFEAGWVAAKGRPRVASEAEVEAMSREVCAPFCEERAVRL